MDLQGVRPSVFHYLRNASASPQDATRKVSNGLRYVQARRDRNGCGEGDRLQLSNGLAPEKDGDSSPPRAAPRATQWVRASLGITKAASLSIRTIERFRLGIMAQTPQPSKLCRRGSCPRFAITPSFPPEVSREIDIPRAVKPASDRRQHRRRNAGVAE